MLTASPRAQVDPLGNASLAAQRYAALQATVAPSVRRYNTPWSSFEVSNVAPATTPIPCPTGYTMVRALPVPQRMTCPPSTQCVPHLVAVRALASVSARAEWCGRLDMDEVACGAQVPNNQGELQSRGYNMFHCYLTSLLQQFQAYLALDAAHGIESAAVIWGSAPLSCRCMCRPPRPARHPRAPGPGAVLGSLDRASHSLQQSCMER